MDTINETIEKKVEGLKIDKKPEKATPDQTPTATTAPPTTIQAQATPIAQVAPDPPKATNPIPTMNNARIFQRFNRMDRDSTFVSHTVQIANQDTLSGETYDQLAQISTVTLPITRANFIAMWKSLLLKRIQDVFEQEYGTRPDHHIRVTRTITGPATLMDLLHACGSFFSAVTGRQHFIVQPARAAEPENFWTVAQNNLRDWTATMRYMEKAYVIKEFPSQRETDARPIVLTYRLTNARLMQIKALTNEPRMPDAFIRMVNDDIFAAHTRFNVNNCALNMTAPMDFANIRGRYVAGYITRTNI